ncbi:hypothetical protein [Rhodopila sp.]|uniref:hypothetical protein n=1 Tax=Rhodopila sp. TaxID=2480087 RepID=UPI002C2D7252|nr:hypothetical protein [Rhodopila sp.]HVZ09557.1 hypothetical protein [Rhodopila sp.]
MRPIAIPLQSPTHWPPGRACQPPAQRAVTHFTAPTAAYAMLKTKPRQAGARSAVQTDLPR